MKSILLFLLFTSQFLFSQLNINHSVTLNICDNNLDGIEMVDLNNTIPLISSDATLTYKFFNTNSDAQNNINPIPNVNIVTSNKIIFVRVTALSSMIDFAVIQINLLDCSMSTSDHVFTKKTVVFPNPAHDYISINSKENFALKEIYSLDGNKIKSSKENKIFISELKPGVYILKLLKNNSFETIKFIKL
ncbi:T9SS type A sorting domain-containing protein [Kaistella flava (ex Peng et al. 2021)]|nr:T9SS type A sorting domain-containing protein [Kaistella flava (ex Peng et al. 2021)]